MTPDRLKDLARAYNAYFDEVIGCFVQRDDLVNLLRFAAAQRQHVLVFGPPGTGKTNVSDVVFGGIEGAEKFATELSMFMAEDAIYGPYDMKAMRDDGQLRHRVEGMLPVAHFARLGEFLDGSMPLLRSLLGALHERRLRRGAQVIDMPLLTVFCDTNVHPGHFLKKNENAWAVLDRLLFITSVDYIVGGENIGEMIGRFQSGATRRTSARISLAEINELSELIVNPPSLIRDQLILMKLGAALEQYRSARREKIKNGEFKDVILPDITDRRFCIGSQMLEVSAVLAGRLEVVPDDMKAMGYVLGSSQGERELWEEIADQAIREIDEERAVQLNHVQILATRGIMDRASAIPAQSSDVEADATTIAGLIRELSVIVPENDAVAQAKNEVGARLDQIRESIACQLLESRGIGNVR